MSYHTFLRVINFSFLISLIFVINAHASVVITGTRVIFPSNDKEVTVRVSNKGNSPVLIQSWIDDGDTKSTPDNIRVPFVLTPPINRIDPSSGQTLRIRSTPNKLPTDRESVFWLNVLEIPAVPQEVKKTGANYLQVAFRSRIKVFWRPNTLEGTPNKAAEQLIWSKGNSGLHVKNPTPYFVSLASVNVDGKAVDGKMIAPFSDDNYKINVSPGSKLKINFVNDYGALAKIESVVR